MRTVFGPVPSRRLGRSLGIDVIPPKTCTYDCLYCESGPTTHLSLERRAFLEPDRVIRDLEEYFGRYPQGADVLTFSSAGEPTLYEPLGELIRAIKRRFPSLPLIVLTNGSLLWEPAVRKDLMAADRVVPSLDAVTPETFEWINRPHPKLDLVLILEGLHAFRREYSGELHIEIVLASGCNDSPEHLALLRKATDRIGPDLVELNTVVRPPAYTGVRGLNRAGMRAVSEFFPREKTQIVGEFKESGAGGKDADLGGRILEMVRRRPCTALEMAASLGVKIADIDGALARLSAEGLIGEYAFEDRRYLCACSRKKP